jgi:hypothetical protein
MTLLLDSVGSAIRVIVNRIANPVSSVFPSMQVSSQGGIGSMRRVQTRGARFAEQSGSPVPIQRRNRNLSIQPHWLDAPVLRLVTMRTSRCQRNRPSRRVSREISGEPGGAILITLDECGHIRMRCASSRKRYLPLYLRLSSACQAFIQIASPLRSLSQKVKLAVSPRRWRVVRSMHVCYSDMQFMHPR